MKRVSLDKASHAARLQVEESFAEIVKEEAKKRGISVVVPKMYTIYSDQDLDITSDILKLLNKKLKTVAVKFE